MGCLFCFEGSGGGLLMGVVDDLSFGFGFGVSVVGRVGWVGGRR